MKKIPLRGKYGRGKFAKVDDDVYEWASEIKWYLGNHGYASKSFPKVLMHTAIMGKKAGHYVDHINRDRRDNRRSNLRFVTPAQSAKNMQSRPRNIHGLRGICWCKRTKSWQVQVRSDEV